MNGSLHQNDLYILRPILIIVGCLILICYGLANRKGQENVKCYLPVWKNIYISLEDFHWSFFGVYLFRIAVFFFFLVKNFMFVHILSLHSFSWSVDLYTQVNVDDLDHIYLAEMWVK